MRYGLAIGIFLSACAIVLAQGFDDRLNTNVQGPSTRTPAKDVLVKRGTTWRIRPEFPDAERQLTYANGLRANKRLKAAYNAYNALVYAWPDSAQAVTAQVACAEVAEARGDYVKSFDEYQYLIDRYVGQFDFQRTLERQFAIANYLMTARRGKFLFLPGFEASERALPLFEKIVQNAPSWEQAPLAQMNIGTIHEKNDDWEQAITAYEVLQNRYEGSSCTETAAFREASCQYRLYLDRPNDVNACNAARSTLVRFIQTYPGSQSVGEARQNLDRLNQRIETLAYERAVFYDELAKRPRAALMAYQDFVRKFPESERAQLASRRIETLRKDIKADETL